MRTVQSVQTVCDGAVEMLQWVDWEREEFRTAAIVLYERFLLSKQFQPQYISLTVGNITDIYWNFSQCR